jgi:hypothetical protein
VKLRYFLLLFGLLLFLGCNRGTQTPEAVRQAVVDHLAKRSDLDVSSMQVDVTSVSFREDEAEATVSFRAKGSAPASGMQMRYTLEREGNRWVVKGKGQAPSGAEPHGQTPGGGAASPHSGSDLPAGHPPMGAGKAPESPKK